VLAIALSVCDGSGPVESDGFGVFRM
jgi:hypothetical protein